MTLSEAIVVLALVLRAENAALAAGDAAGAARLLPEKQAAVAALREATPVELPSLAAVKNLRDLVAENGERLALAIEVQGRVLELVARAARHAQPALGRYGRKGMASESRQPVALAVRA